MLFTSTLGLRRFAKTATLAPVLGLAAVPPTLSQSLDIPLQLVDAGPGAGVRLIINVGIGGAPAYPYLFDTGSNLFNAAYLPPSGKMLSANFGNVPSSMANLPTGVTYGYTDGSSYVGNFVTVSSLSFYQTATSNSPSVVLNAVTPSGAQGSFVINAVTNRCAAGSGYTAPNCPPINGGPFMGMTTPNQLPLEANGSAFGGIYGTFGAGNFTDVTGASDHASISGVAYGSVLGQAVVQNTTAGYIVAANGYPLRDVATTTGMPVTGATTNGPQVGQNVPSCSPCVILGLTPQLLAQFQQVNALAAGSEPANFPNSGAPSSGRGAALNVTVSVTSNGTTTSWTQPTLFDSGTAYYNLHNPNNAISNVSSVTIADTQSNTAFSSGPYSVTVGSGNTNTVGIPFFLENSVLYNLQGQVVAFTPNFVTDTPIVTTPASPLIIGSNSVPLGLAGVISGSGGLSITSGGSATLSGTNTYTGATTITGGTLALVGTGSIASSSSVAVANNGIFDISGIGNIVGAPPSTSITSLSGTTGATVALGGNQLVITSASGTYAGTIADGGLSGGSGGSILLTGGIETLTGVNTYTGATTIAGGMLVVNGSIATSSGININSGAMLAGAGAVPQTTVNSGGTLQPGTPGVPGTILTINGNLAFQSGAAYLVNINGTTASRANVTGAVTLNGALELELQSGSSFNTKTAYNILDPSSISGRFTSVGGFNAPGFSGNVTYTANGALINLTANIGGTSGSSGLNANQQNVGTALNNYFNSGGTLPSSFLPLFAAPRALTQADGEVTTGSQFAAFQLMDQFLDVMLDPFVYGRLGSGVDGGGFGGSPTMSFAPDAQTILPSELALAYAGIFKAPPPARFEQRWTAWAASYGGSNTTSGSASVGSTNITAGTYGFAAGLDYHYSPDTVVGFALGGAGSNWGLANGLGTGKSDAFQAGVYGMTRTGRSYIAGALALANNWFTTDRTAPGDALTGAFTGQSYSARLEGGYRFPLVPDSMPRAIIGVTPYGALQTQDFHTQPFSESDVSGGGLGLSYGSMNAADVRTELGARFDDPTLVAGMPLILLGRLAWAHDFVTNPSLSAAFEALSGTSFTVNGAPMPQNSALATAGAELFISPRWILLVKFDGQFASGSQTYAGTGTLRYTW